MAKRILSGIQPSGTLHLGNYFGAIQQHIELQEEGEALYFIADYHAMTTIHDGREIDRLSFDVAADYLALGLDPAKASLFRQTQVPQVTELAWILGCVTGKGLLDRATSYKDKVSRGVAASVGLYTYPVLMAADILIYRSNVVPVGADQTQHLEMARDMAQKFNQTYRTELFPIPEPRFNRFAKVPGTRKDPDGSFQKMSKSYGNTIEIFLEGKALKERIMAIQTDSTPVAGPKNPDTCIVMQLYKLFASDAEVREMEERYRKGGYGYGDAKKALLAKMDEVLAPMREKRRRLAADPDTVRGVLEQGAAKARRLAGETMEHVRRLTAYGGGTGA